MSRIEQAFNRCREAHRAALVGYLTAFDPDREGSLARLRAACDAGVDVLELGVAFSDPTADGGEIQLAMRRALGSGSTLDGVLELARALRETHDTPIVLFSYANPLLARREGIEATVRRIVDAGIDGLLIVDLPPESAAVLREPARAAGLDWIGLVAPTTTPHRLSRILAQSSGFVYAVSLTGVTGSQLDAASPDLDAYLTRIDERTDLPLAVGFGVRTPEQARALVPRVQGVVVGSALVRAGRSDVATLRSAVEQLAAAMQRGT